VPRLDSQPSPQDEQGLGAEKCYAFKGQVEAAEMIRDGDGTPEMDRNGGAWWVWNALINFKW